MSRRYDRPSAKAWRDKRWPALRLAAKRRDGWACVQCGSKHRLEVDHVLPVRDRPDLSFVLTNLQTLCGSCHAKKTRVEVGHPELSPERQAWRDLVADMRRQPSSNIGDTNA